MSAVLHFVAFFCFHSMTSVFFNICLEECLSSLLKHMLHISDVADAINL